MIRNHQCDCLKENGERCKRKSSWEIPCAVSGGADGMKHVMGRPVFLCNQHASKYHENTKNKKRTAVIEGGFLGPWGPHDYGNMVLNVPEVKDWNEKLKIPIYWYFNPSKDGVDRAGASSVSQAPQTTIAGSVSNDLLGGNPVTKG